MRIYLILIFIFILPLFSQKGDKKDKPGVVQNDPIPADGIPPAPALKVKDALKSFKVEKGFTLEVVAQEPMIQDPVALTFDGDGRMWVVEMRAYMPNVDGTGEDKKIGRISILEDFHTIFHFFILY